MIRGTAARTGGYFTGVGLALLSAPLLTRYLGVEEYGDYVVVISLVGVAAIFADTGLSAVAVREYSVRGTSGRTDVVQNLLSVRLLASAFAGVAALVFALAAGYEAALIAGTALGALALAPTMAQRTYAIPLVAELRLELVSGLDLLRQILTVAGIVALILAGAGLVAFYALPIPVAIAVLAVTLLLAKRYGSVRPAARRSEWLFLLGEMPAAAASVLGGLFYRVGIIMMSLLATSQQTGYFGLSLGVVDVFAPVATLIAGSAFPILARAAEADRKRLGFAFRQLFDVSVILGIGTAFVLVAGAEPIVRFLGGAEFEPAVPVLRIQGLAIAATFLVTLFSYMLWVVRARRPLVVGNLVGLGAAIVLTAALIPAWEARGAAMAMVISESVLAAWLGLALLSSRAEIRPRFRTVAKAVVAVTVAGVIAVMPIPPLAGVIIGAMAYVVVLLALRAIPLEIWRAMFGEWRKG